MTNATIMELGGLLNDGIGCQSLVLSRLESYGTIWALAIGTYCN